MHDKGVISTNQVVIPHAARVTHSIKKLQNLYRYFSAAADLIAEICGAYRAMLILQLSHNFRHLAHMLREKKMIQGHESNFPDSGNTAKIGTNFCLRDVGQLGDIPNPRRIVGRLGQ
jgi:putative intracellular protease/amidase